MKRATRFSWLLPPALLGVAAMSLYDAGQLLAARHWQWTAATASVVSRSEFIDFVPGAEDKGRKRRARLVLEYAPTGAPEQVALVVEQGALGAAAEPGSTLPIRYDPVQPDRVVVEPSGLGGAVWRFALGGVSLVLGAGVAWRVWRKRTSA